MARTISIGARGFRKLPTEFAGRGEELFGGLDVWEGGLPVASYTLLSRC